MTDITHIAQTVELNSGAAMPWLGLGTWQVADGDEVIRTVSHALEIGYRHIDTAAAYGNEKGVGEAMRASGLDRSEIFLTTKLANGDQRDRRQADALDDSLRRLGLDHIDLYLIHWPVPDRFVESWSVMEKAVEAGKVRTIGVSNFHQHHLEQLLAETDIVPAVNQVEFHPRLAEWDLVEFCRDKGIQYEAWSPLVRGRVDDMDPITRIARDIGRSPAQVILRWDLQHRIVTIPRSTNPDHISENAEVFDFALTDEQMAEIDALNDGGRTGPHPDHVSF